MIRPTVVCAFLHDEKILVKIAGSSPPEYQLLGGDVDFGEHSIDALKREIKEELGADITLPEYLGVIENIFTHQGKTSHQIVFVYNARFVEPGFYNKKMVDVDENGVKCVAVWKPLSFFIKREAPLYPEGLLELLMR